MIDYLIVEKCDTCYDRGVIFIGDNNEYWIEPCECVEVNN